MSSELVLCALEELVDGKAVRFDGPGYRVAVVRIGDDVFCVDDMCSHQDYSLSEGVVDADECTLECWKHGSTFDLRSGEPTTLPATQPVPVYELAVRDGQVVLSL